MTLSPDESEVVRRTVRALLERSPGHRQLAPARQSDLATDMVNVLDTKIARLDPAGAAGLVAKVDFPAFVAGLVHGTFEAVVDGSIQQMEAYADLVRGVASGAGGQLPGAAIRLPSRPDKGARPVKIGVDIVDVGSDAPVPENIRAVAAIYLAFEFEEMRVFDVVDRLVELFRTGQLPLGAGNNTAAQLLMQPSRLTPAERRETYQRVLCADGANRDGEARWGQFLAAVQAAVAGSPADPRPPQLLDPVRTAGLALARLASERGFGAAHFLATELVQELGRRHDILSNRAVQTAFAVRDAWQLVERIATTYLGGTPDTVSRRTRGVSGLLILEWLADRARILGAGPLPLLAIADPVEKWLAAAAPEPPSPRRLLPKRR